MNGRHHSSPSEPFAFGSAFRFRLKIPLKLRARLHAFDTRFEIVMMSPIAT